MNGTTPQYHGRCRRDRTGGRLNLLVNKESYSPIARPSPLAVILVLPGMRGLGRVTLPGWVTGWAFVLPTLV